MRLVLACVAVVIACSKGTPSYRSNFAEVKLTANKQITTTAGEPYSGKLVAMDAEIVEVGRVVLGETVFAELTKQDPSGLILVMPVDKGRPQGKATLMVDLRAKKISPDLVKDGRLAIAKAIAPIHTVAEATFKDGVLDGTAVAYGPGGSDGLMKVAEVPFKAGAINGTVTEYHPGSTQPKRTMVFVNNVPSGPEKTFYKNGQIERDATQVAGKYDGEVVEYYANGAKRARDKYVGGDRMGPREAWFPSGQLQRKVERADDLEMRITEWYSNGSLALERSPAGETVHPKHGTIETFHRDGTLASRATYEQGVLVGSFKRWYENGQLWEDATYDAGKLHGPRRTFWKNGKPAEVALYDQGRLDGDYRKHYDNGARWIEAKYQLGKPVGTLQRWFPDGKLGYIQHHENGRPHGPFKRWWADGKPRLEATYSAGQLDGAFKNWLEDGSLYEDAMYERGRLIRTTRTPTEAQRQ